MRFSAKTSSFVNVPLPPPPCSRAMLPPRPCNRTDVRSRRRSARRPRHVADRRGRAIERCVRACQIMQLVGGVAGLLIYISVTAANIRFFPFLVSPAAASPCSPLAPAAALPTLVVPA